MNQLESRYAELLMIATQTKPQEVATFRFERIKLRLADSTFYSPDFMVVRPDGLIEFHEVKGHWEDDARVKVKVAAEMYPEFRFVAVMWDRREGWKYEHFNKEQ
jgi:hypothetical protein